MYPVLPHKKGFKPRKLGHKQYIYEPVSFGTEGKDEPLELILTQFIEGNIFVRYMYKLAWELEIWDFDYYLNK